MRAKMISSAQSQLQDLRELSARIGRDPLLVQANSGNTSFKIDGILWIKASGKWLIRAEEDDFLVPVNLANARSSFRETATISEADARSSASPYASIETAMHVVLPQKVVVHVHSVNTIAWSVREDAATQLSSRLSELQWQWIPYTPSGTPLARRIENALSRFPHTNVFVLGNHGLVICGDDCQSAEDLLAEVEQRLFIRPRPTPQPRYGFLEQALSESAWCLPACASIHALATDHISRRIISGGVLYPCQAIFLPGISNMLASSASFNERCCGKAGHASQPPLRIVVDQGVLTNKHMKRAEEEMLVGLMNVVQRIDASAPLRYLAPSEVMQVLSKEGQNYQQSAGLVASRGA